MMRPLSKEEEVDAEVTWEDQNNINTFSKLHNKLLDLQDLLTEKNVPPQNPHNPPPLGGYPQGWELMVDTSRVDYRCVTGD